MYPPPQFTEQRRAVLLDAIRALRFGTVVTACDGAQIVSHLPVDIEADLDSGPICLNAHVARANEHWRATACATTVAVFQGPHAYIRPGWLSGKKLHGKVVPTWNYIAVHAHGTLETVHDRDWLHEHLRSLSDAAEAGRSEPWSLSDAPATFVENLVPAIVGIRLRVTRLTGIWKLSQHHSLQQRAEAVAGLNSEETRDSSREIGAAMMLATLPIE